MKNSISIAKLKAMSPAQRDERLSALVKSTDRMPNGEVETLERSLKKFEEEFGYSSADLVARLAKGEIAETPGIMAWLMTIRMRERLAKISARPR